MLCPPGTTSTEEHWGFCVGSLNQNGSQMRHLGWSLLSKDWLQECGNHLPKGFLFLVIWTCHWKALAQQNPDVQIMIQPSYMAIPHTTGNNNNENDHNHLYVNPAELLDVHISDIWSQWPLQPLTKRFWCSISSFSCSLPPWCCGNLHWSSFNVVDNTLKIHFGNYSLQMITCSNISQ